VYSICTKSNTRFYVLEGVMLKIDTLWDGTLCLMASIFLCFMEWYAVSKGEYTLIIYGMVRCVFGQEFSDNLWDGTLCLMASIY
jgi:hypothetical protein